MKYYKPTPDELVDGLELEMYYQDQWHKFTFSIADNGNIQMDDLRVKYLDSIDFNQLGYTCQQVHVGKQTVVVDIITHPDKEDEEITEEIDVYNPEILIVVKDGKPVGNFYPYLPESNVEIKGKTHSIKNLSELRKILKL